MSWGTFLDCCCQCPHLCGEGWPTLPQETLQHYQVQSPVESLLSSSWSWYRWDFVCAPPKTGVSVSPSPMEVLQSNTPGLQDQIPWTKGFPVLCQIPRLGSMTWGSEPSQQWENFFGIIVLQFVGHPPGGHGIWFYRNCAPPTISLQLLLCLWMRGIFFWWVAVSSCRWWFNS